MENSEEYSLDIGIFIRYYVLCYSIYYDIIYTEGIKDGTRKSNWRQNETRILT